MLYSLCCLKVPRDILWQGYLEVVPTGGLGPEICDFEVHSQVPSEHEFEVDHTQTSTSCSHLSRCLDACRIERSM